MYTIPQANARIAECAKYKRLDEARGVLEEAEGSGIANSYTYAIAINACVRCGAVEEGRGLLKRMKAKGLKVGVVAYTTLLKVTSLISRCTDASNSHHTSDAPYSCKRGSAVRAGSRRPRSSSRRWSAVGKSRTSAQRTLSSGDASWPVTSRLRADAWRT